MKCFHILIFFIFKLTIAWCSRSFVFYAEGSTLLKYTLTDGFWLAPCPSSHNRCLAVSAKELKGVEEGNWLPSLICQCFWQSVPSNSTPYQGLWTCASRECRPQAQNLTHQISAGTFHPNLFMTICYILFLLQAHFSQICTLRHKILLMRPAPYVQKYLTLPINESTFREPFHYDREKFILSLLLFFFVFLVFSPCL